METNQKKPATEYVKVLFYASSLTLSGGKSEALGAAVGRTAPAFGEAVGITPPASTAAVPVLADTTGAGSGCRSLVPCFCANIWYRVRVVWSLFCQDARSLLVTPSLSACVLFARRGPHKPSRVGEGFVNNRIWWRKPRIST